MRIAMFCSGRFPTPPPKGTIYAPLWINSLLAEEMTKRGHKVTLFGAKGTRSNAKVVTLDLLPLEANRRLKGCTDVRKDRAISFYEQLFISEIYKRAGRGEFDVIHIHPAELAIGFAVNSSIPTIFTLHDPISCWRKFVYSSYKSKNIYFVSISDSQRAPLKNINYIATIYNGIDLSKYPFGKTAGNYFFIASRLVPPKGIDLAIKVAIKARIALKITGEIVDKSYWEQKIKPFIGGKIKYEGMIPYEEIPKFYKNAKAFLFPIQWDEPFGLVMIEAMACGTPVVAFDRGSVREVVKNGETGFIVPPLDKNKEPNISGMVEVIKKVDTIDRSFCRQYVKDNFNIQRMVDKYEEVYRKISKK